MHFLTFTVVSILCLTISTTAQQAHNLPDSSLAELPVLDPEDSEESIDSPNHLDVKTETYPDISFVSYDFIKPADSTAPSHVNKDESEDRPTPTLLADDETPPIELDNPPCPFGNPIVPGSDGKAAPMVTSLPEDPSRQLFCCINNFRICIKYFAPTHDRDSPRARDPRCIYKDNWSCCSGIKGGGTEGVGLDCKKALFADKSSLQYLIEHIPGPNSRQLDLPARFRNLPTLPEGPGAVPP